VAHAQAGEADFEQPVQVKSESQMLDGKNKTSLFWENVSITQGSLNIEADEVEVNGANGKGKEIFIAKGKPASYRQNTDNGNVVEAKAFEIRYDVSTRTISLKGNAELIQDTSSVQGDSIVYDMEKEQLLAESSGDSDDNRVTTVFSPESIDKIKQETEKNKDDDQ
jgi:lipopolysaccharide export system protein LptA